jgi:hypothetical protein
VDILITKDSFHTLMDIVVIDPTHTNMVQQALTTSHVVMMATQKKTHSYIE